MRFIVGCATLVCVLSLATKCHASGTFELFNADTDQTITELKDGAVIALNEIFNTSRSSMSIKVTFPNLSVTSVKFGLDSNPKHKVEMVSPFTLCGNKGTDIFRCSELGLGSHTVTATPYKSQRRFPRRQVVAGDTVRATFTIVNRNCPKGYEKATNGSDVCVDIDECQDPSRNTCHTNATCSNYRGSYWCTCQSMFRGNGTFCELNPCRATSCIDCLNAECRWMFGGSCTDYRCNQLPHFKCYERRPPFDSAAVCAAVEDDARDDVLCGTQTNCTSCQATMKSNSTPCLWHQQSYDWTRTGQCGAFFLYGRGIPTLTCGPSNNATNATLL